MNYSFIYLWTIRKWSIHIQWILMNSCRYLHLPNPITRRNYDLLMPMFKTLQWQTWHLQNRYITNANKRIWRRCSLEGSKDFFFYLFEACFTIPPHMHPTKYPALWLLRFLSLSLLNIDNRLTLYRLIDRSIDWYLGKQ